MRDVNLSEWINSDYVHEYEQSTLQSRMIQKPIKFVHFRNFFDSSKLSVLRSITQSAVFEKGISVGLAEETEWEWAPLNLHEFIKFWYSRQFRSFLEDLVGRSLAVKPLACPQINKINSGSPGLKIHTDEHEKVNLVCVLQLTQGYVPGDSGELCFHMKNATGFVTVAELPPLFNSLTIFEVNETSFHSVNHWKGSGPRLAVTLDWIYK